MESGGLPPVLRRASSDPSVVFSRGEHNQSVSPLPALVDASNRPCGRHGRRLPAAAPSTSFSSSSSSSSHSCASTRSRSVSPAPLHRLSQLLAVESRSRLRRQRIHLASLSPLRAPRLGNAGVRPPTPPRRRPRGLSAVVEEDFGSSSASSSLDSPLSSLLLSGGQEVEEVVGEEEEEEEEEEWPSSVVTLEQRERGGGELPPKSLSSSEKDFFGPFASRTHKLLGHLAAHRSRNSRRTAILLRTSSEKRLSAPSAGDSLAEEERPPMRRRISFRELVDVATFDKESKVEDFQQPSTCCLLHPG